MAAAKILPFKPTGVTNGRWVEILTTSTALHTAVNAVDDSLDAVTIEVHNTTGSAITFTLEWGGTASPNITTYALAAGEMLFVASAKRAWGGLAITGKGSAIGCRASVSVDRYTPES